ncbi:SAM-dependent methyltransferase, partial [Phytohabitans rumicis]
KANRAWLGRVVRFLARQGATQFLDIGSGIPTMGNVHEIAQQVAPGARVLYVDIDPVAVMHSRQMLTDNPLAAAVEGDVRRPQELIDRIESDPGLKAIIDLDRPVALILAAVLHFVPDDDEAYGAVEVLRDRLAPGSWLAISHGAVEGFGAVQAAGVQQVYEKTRTPGGLRTREGITRFFDGFDLVQPGIVW